MKIHKFTVIFEPDVEKGGVYNVLVPALPGCFSFGESLAEARYNIREAMELYLEALLDEDGAIPKDKKIKGVKKGAIKEEIIIGVDYDIKAGFEKKLTTAGYAR